MTAAIGAEWLKLRRSRLWWITLLATTVAALAGALFIFIGQDPDRARALGLLGAKAQLASIPADWNGHFGLLAQIIAVGGIFIFGILTIWMFGREYADRTMKDLLALPTSRTAIICAKFIVIDAWCLLLTGYAYAIGLATGALLGLPGWSLGVAGFGLLRLVVTATMTVGLTTVLALAASVGRGYLAAFGTMVVTVFLAQIIAALGYGQYFPWSVPALFSGLAGPDTSSLPVLSFVSVAAVVVAATTATVVWANRADQAG
jgi:ABC-2 type transport system permease protein